MLLTVTKHINEYLSLAKEPSDDNDTNFLRTVFCGRKNFLEIGRTYPFLPTAKVWNNCGEDIVLNGVHDANHKYSNGLLNEVKV
jgi:hypothetical protein